MMRKYILAIASAVLVTNCNPQTTSQNDAEPDLQEAHNEEPAQTDCADDGDRLPETGICKGRATNYMNIVGDHTPALPDNCQWVVNETAMPGGEYLLYLAAECQGQPAKLEFSGGAHFADLNLVWSALANSAFEENTLVKITSADMENPHKNILFQAKNAMEDKTEASKCMVRAAGSDGWPIDALVIDVSAEEAAKAPTDEPRWACGPFGLDQENTSYWRVFQGFSWWFQLTQDAWQDIDPRSLTLITPDETGGWTTAE